MPGGTDEKSLCICPEASIAAHAQTCSCNERPCQHHNMPGTQQSPATTSPKGHTHSVATAQTKWCGVGWNAGSWPNASLQSTPLTRMASPPLAWPPSSPPSGQHPRNPASPRTWSLGLAPGPRALEPLPGLSSPRCGSQVYCIVSFTQQCTSSGACCEHSASTKS